MSMNGSHRGLWNRQRQSPCLRCRTDSHLGRQCVFLPHMGFSNVGSDDPRQHEELGKDYLILR